MWISYNSTAPTSQQQQAIGEVWGTCCVKCGRQGACIYWLSGQPGAKEGKVQTNQGKVQTKQGKVQAKQGKVLRLAKEA